MGVRCCVSIETNKTILKWLFLGIVYFRTAFILRPTGIQPGPSTCIHSVLIVIYELCCKSRQNAKAWHQNKCLTEIFRWMDGMMAREHVSGATCCCCDVKQFAWRLTIFQFIFIPKVTFHCNAWRALILKSHEYAVAVAVAVRSTNTNSHLANVGFVKSNVSAFAIKRTQYNTAQDISFVWIEYERRRMFVGKWNELSFLVMKCLMATASITLRLPHMHICGIQWKRKCLCKHVCAVAAVFSPIQKQANIDLNNTWWQCVLSIFSCE